MMPIKRRIMIHDKPIVGRIYKVEVSSGRIWLFKSAFDGENLTRHKGACCIYSEDDERYYERYATTETGRNVCQNCNIISMKLANENEVVIFERRVCL